MEISNEISNEIAIIMSEEHRNEPCFFSPLWNAKPQTYTPFISPNAQSLRTELHFQFIRFAAATLLFAFTPSVGFPHFGECGLKNGAR